MHELTAAGSVPREGKRPRVNATTPDIISAAAKACLRIPLRWGWLGASIVLAACETGPTAAVDRTAKVDAPGSIRWEMQSAVGSKLRLIGEYGMRFSNEIAARSNGQIQLAFLEPGTRASALQIPGALRGGQFEAGYTSPGYMAETNPAFLIFSGTPFGPSARDHYAWLQEGGGLTLYDDLYARFNLKAVPCVMAGPEGFGWFRRAVQTPDDLRGLKMRFWGIGAKVMRKLGVSIQQQRGADVYPALERGLIDATEYSTPYIDLDLSFYQIAQHYYYPSFHMPFHMFEVVFTRDRWNSLSREQQRLIEDVCHDNVLFAIAEDEPKAVNALE